jgi:adenine-specific DNA-methyltransferase
VADALIGPPPAADVVVGNPPWGQKGFALPPAERDRLRATFVTCARGPIDAFAPFVELAHRALAPGGRWALVLPDVVLLKDQEPVRRLMLEESALELIAHAGRAFPGVNLDAVVIAGRRGAPPPRHAVEVWTELSARRRRRIPQRVFAGLPGRVLNLHLDPPARAALARLAALPRLGDAFEIHEGVHSGNARRKLFVAARPRHGARLIVGGDELSRFHLRWAGRWLDRSPTALDRAAGDYANLGRAAWFEAAKIVVRRTGDRVIAAFDDGGFHVSNNLFVVLPRAAASPTDLLAVTALLNSRLMTGYFRTVVPRVGRLFAELKIHHLASFPLPPADRLAARRAVLAALAGDRAAAHGDPARAAALDAALDAEVESLYPESRALVASSKIAP